MTRLVAALAALGATALACEQPASVIDYAPAARSGGPLCTAGGFCWAHPRPQGNPLRAIAGTAGDDVWAVGASGTILHFDGERWSTSASGTDADLADVWAAAPDDVWAVGGQSILHFDGARWSTAAVSGNVATWLAVSGSARNDIWAVGKGGAVGHFDGAAWTFSTIGGAGDLRTLAVLATDDVWAAGFPEAIVHFDGTAWRRVASLAQVGDIVIGDGEIWMLGLTQVDRWTGSAFELIRATGASAGWIEGGERWLFGGTAQLPGPAPARPNIEHQEGDGWRDLAAEWELSPVGTIVGAWGPPGAAAAGGPGAHGLWAVTDEGALLRYQGERFAPWMAGELEPPLQAIGGFADDDVWAVGDSHASPSFSEDGELQVSVTGGIRRGNATGFVPYPDETRPCVPDEVIRTSPNSTMSHLICAAIRGQIAAISASGPDDAWAVGDSLLHWNGRSWIASWRPTDGILRAVWSASSDDVWAVGDAGTVVHHDGKSWSTIDTPTSRDLRAIWGSGPNDVYAAGDIVLHWDGHAFAVSLLDVPAPLRDVAGNAPTDVWATGDDSTVLHFDGQTWSDRSPLFDPTFEPPIQALAVTPAQVLVGAGPDLLRWDGAGWQREPTGIARNIVALWSAPNGALWVLTERNGILRRAP